MPLMSLDSFLFEIGTLPYEQMTQDVAWRYAKTDRFGAPKSTQFLGIGDQTLSLTGALYPGEGIGAYSAIDTLYAMADAGEAYVLLSGQGDVMGNYAIESISVNRSYFLIDGVSRKADFTLNLFRTEE